MRILHAKHILVKVDKTPSSMLLSYQQNAIVIINYGKMSNIFGQSAINIHCQQMTEKNPYVSFILEKKEAQRNEPLV